MRAIILSASPGSQINRLKIIRAYTVFYSIKNLLYQPFQVLIAGISKRTPIYVRSTKIFTVQPAYTIRSTVLIISPYIRFFSTYVF